MKNATLDSTTIHHDHEWINDQSDVDAMSNIELAIGYIEAEITRLQGILKCLKS